MNDRERLLDALPSFVNGTLSAEDRAWVQAQLDAAPELRSQLEFQRRVREQVRGAAQRDLEGVPVDVGYAAVAQWIAQERGEGAPSRPPQATPGLLSRWLGAIFSPAPAWRLAQGMALGLLVGGGAMLAMQKGHDDETGTVRSVAPASSGPLLRVNFDKRASEEQIRLALIDARVRIVAGPTRLGDYYVAPATGRTAAAARESLLKSRTVVRADEVASLPEGIDE